MMQHIIYTEKKIGKKKGWKKYFFTIWRPVNILLALTI